HAGHFQYETWQSGIFAQRFGNLPRLVKLSRAAARLVGAAGAAGPVKTETTVGHSWPVTANSPANSDCGARYQSRGVAPSASRFGSTWESDGADCEPCSSVSKRPRGRGAGPDSYSADCRKFAAECTV